VGAPLLRHMQTQNLTRVEPTAAAEAAGTEHVRETALRLLLIRVNSWMTGTNTSVPWKDQRTFLAYAGGVPAYHKRDDKVARRVTRGYEGFALQEAACPRGREPATLDSGPEVRDVGPGVAG
jgi:hypothetical protein